MKILHELRKAKGFTSFLATTFNVDLPWFEALLLRQLGLNGIKRFVVFADDQQLSQAIFDEADSLRRAGRTYLIQGVQVASSFHPKIFLLAGEKAARLYVGSGNLSKGGLQYNLEVFERWDFEIGDGGDLPGEFVSARDYFYQLAERSVEYCSPILRSALEQTFSLPPFHQKLQTEVSSSLLFSPPRLIDSIPAVDVCDDLTIVTPYFDEKAGFVTELVKRLNASSFSIITDIRKTNLTPGAANRIEEMGGELLVLDQDKHPRALHAKMYFAKANGWAWGAIGSANASIAAWHAHNAEAMTVKVGPDAHAIEELIQDLQTRTLNEGDWLVLEKTGQLLEIENENKEEIKSAPRILFAEWISFTRIRLNIVPGSWEIEKIEFLADTLLVSSEITVEKEEDGSPQLHVAYPGNPDRSRVNLLRVSGVGGSGAWTIIHDPEELRAQAGKSSQEREKLEELLGSEYFDPDAAQKLMELFARLLETRTQRNRHLPRPAATGRGPQEDEDSISRPDIRDVNLADFESREMDSTYAATGSAGLSIFSVRQMNRLLYGDIDDTLEVIDTEGESELDENEIIGDDSHLPSNSSRRTYPQKTVDRAKQEDFLSAAKNAREKYISELFSEAGASDKPPHRLLDDLQVLTAPMHYMLQGGGMSTSGFRGEMVRTLRAFLGSASAPFIVSLKNLNDDDLREFWNSTPAFSLIHLLIYNTCLADAGVSTGTNKKHIPGFVNALPVLWLRHVIRTVPEDLLDSLRHKIKGIVPLLRCGALWIADMFPALQEKFSFPDFVLAMIDQTHLLDNLELHFDGKFSKFKGRTVLASAEDEGAILLGRRTKGGLGFGWAEDGQIYIHDGAFQKPEEDAHYEQMPRVENNQAVSIPLLETQENITDDDTIRGFRLIEAIDP